MPVFCSVFSHFVHSPFNWNTIFHLFLLPMELYICFSLDSAFLQFNCKHIFILLTTIGVAVHTRSRSFAFLAFVLVDAF